MADLSNKALAVLLLVGIVTSAGSMVLILNNQQGITGRVSDVDNLGYTNFTITSNFSIVFTQNVIPFGSGSVLGGDCEMGSNNSPPTSDPGGNCTGFNTTVDAANLTIQNNGNIPANVSLNFTQNATQFIGGTNPLFRFNVYNHTAGACQETLNGSWPPGAHVQNNTDLRVCNYLDYQAGQNTFGVAIWVRVPPDAPIQANQVTITAIGCDDDSC